VVTELRKKYGFDVELVKKTDVGLFKRIVLPKFPALTIDDDLIFEGRDTTVEELEREVVKRRS